MFRIDGSHGEGGGQILRTSLALSLITGTPFRLIKVRANRKPPGLKKQHLTAIQAAATIGNAKVSGASIGSSQITFEPGEVVPGSYRFAVGTAGSASLVFQTILPPLMLAGAESRLRFEGGTHNPHAPPFDFLDKTFLPLLARFGVRADAKLERHGFYPPGGGAFDVHLTPVAELNSLHLPADSPIRSRCGNVLLVRLPRHIAEREVDTLRAKLGWPAESFMTQTTDTAISPGNVITIEIVRDDLTELFTAVGERGRRAEEVASQVADEVNAYLAHGAPVGSHLADQLLLPMALAGAGSFVTGPLTPHTETNLAVIRSFLDVAAHVESIDETRFLIRFGG
jgi:RNA 3'-terminal phosphate cyclase (ATP)